jgi:hypothetical protein
MGAGTVWADLSMCTLENISFNNEVLMVVSEGYVRYMQKHVNTRR